MVTSSYKLSGEKMNNKAFGYIRVSSKDQNIDRQLTEMLALGIDERDIFIDKMSGKNFDRPHYQALKRCMREGDLLYIKSIDRFGRNSKEIKKEWEHITQDMKVDIRVMDMPLLDTTKHKDVLGGFVSELVLQVLAFVSERERDEIKKRQREGIAAAKAKGKKLGRQPIDLTDDQIKIIKELYPIWKAEGITAVEFMNRVGLLPNTFYRRIKSLEKMGIVGQDNSEHLTRSGGMNS
ncbi:Site-specific DNA recombinase [Thermoactinomyces sp. DSM 45891]|uniref:recombinase family protein n=1 Tax=Thermoactinomyces sp. DSM 45891 TaxID=1761907 RepID=UPI00091F84C1|nr:recombinase family protein [Thermoactinomyces sp. DSM 45891]SFX79271.1 Site-specific DNA recombinase [Thermoactinomyces sp. DSM 45891]